MRERIYRKGDVFLTDFGVPHGSEQGGKRPVVIVQNDDGLFSAPTVTMVPMTTILKKRYQKTHYLLKHSDCVRYPSMVEAEQVHTIDKNRVIRKLGRLDKRALARVEEALRNHFGFDIPDDIEAP